MGRQQLRNAAGWQSAWEVGSRALRDAGVRRVWPTPTSAGARLRGQRYIALLHGQHGCSWNVRHTPNCGELLDGPHSLLDKAPLTSAQLNSNLSTHRKY